MKTAATLVPRTVLFGNPDRMLPQISPDGTLLSYLAPIDGVLNVWVGPLDGTDFLPVSYDRDRGIRTYGWAHNNRHLLYLQDKGGDENWRLYAVDLDNGEVRDLTPFDDVQATIIKTSRRRPSEILVGLNKDNRQLHDVYQLDLASGQLDKVVENPGFVEWLADWDLNVRIGVALQADGGRTIMYRPDDTTEWRALVGFDPEDAMGSGAVGFTADGHTLYLRTSQGVNASRLVAHNLESGDIQVITEDAQYDVGSVVLHPHTGEIQLTVILKDRAEYVLFDELMAADIAELQQLHPGDLSIVDRDHADHTWIVAYTADDGPIAYYLWDRAGQHGRLLFTHRPELAKYHLAKVEPFEFVARDGLVVHGYLTFPPGVERDALPTVLNVHGGPWVRDTWGFNPESQWFANREYLAVQVNYRGSTGYGKAFLNAGDREWGGRMHDDLIDGLNWVIERGYTDPAKVAIYGRSYGGFAALTGATATPDTFCCALDMVGPSNLKTLIESVPPYWQPMIAMLHQRVGNPETESDFLWSRSPLSKVDQIRIPILIAQGANDPRVKQRESEQIVAAMKERDIEQVYLLFEDEGHAFVKPENRLKFFAEAEKFLARHLGGRCEAEGLA